MRLVRRLYGLAWVIVFCGVLWLAWNNGVTARSDVATHDGIPQRVIVTYPGATELLIDLGLEKHIVGTVAPYGEEPPQYKKAYEALPILSGFVPSRETVWQLQPDLIIGWSHHFKPDALGDEAQWSSRGVNTYIVPATIRKGTPTLESTVYPFIDDMGRLFHQEAKAAAYKEGLMARVATVEKRTATMTKHPTVMILQSHGHSTYSLYGPIYIIDDVVKKAGGVNVTNHQISQVGPERVLTYDPDVIVDVLVTSDKGTFRDDAAALAELRADPNLQDLRAVREGRVIAVPFGDINNGNGRVVNALEHISERLNQLMQS